MRKKTKLGLAFVDEFFKYSKRDRHFNNPIDSSKWQDSLLADAGQSEEQLPSAIGSGRKIIVISVLMVAFFGLFLRLFHLQITEGKTNRALADSNRIQVKVVHAPRGVIYDRNGKILAQNEPGFRLSATSSAKTRYLSREEALNLEVKNDPRINNLEIDNLRSYPYKDTTAHILGYVGEVSASELKSAEYQNYKGGDRVGRGGIEQVYEKYLKGIDGGEVIEVDAAGQKLRTLGQRDPIPGQNVYLSIDVSLQQIVYQKLKDGAAAAKVCCGAAVVQDPRNGQILAMVSIPSYNPSDLDNAFNQPNFPFLDRSIAGTYPPGSTFKIATALAGLASGRITPTTSFEDTGVMYLGPYSFGNWYYSQYGRKEEGLVNMVRAIQRSNDIYFYHLAQLVGEDQMGNQAKELGFGKKLGIDLPGEAEGLIPDNNWKVKNISEQWFPGDSLHMAIGQGYVLATPLQISHLVSTIATNGKMFPPHLGLKITTPEERILKEINFEPQKTNLKDADIQVVKSGLDLVPKSGGTAWPFFSFPISTSGKTGTAEFGDPKDQTHAWYTSYAPTENPEIAVTVLVEGGGEGSSVAAPITKEIYRWYFSPDKSNLIKDLYQPAATASARPIGE